MEHGHDWHDAVDHSPGLLCEVELSNGQRILARMVCGGWETPDGEAVYPVRWRFHSLEILTAIYRLPRHLR